MTNYIAGIGKRCRKMVGNEKGQGLVEYALILVLIAIVVITALTTLGTKTNTGISGVGNKLVAPQ
jgi:pilus assembly protein Flp/PilA